MTRFDLNIGDIVQVSKPINGFTKNWKGKVAKIREDVEGYSEPVVYVQKDGSTEGVAMSHVEKIRDK